MKEKSASQLLVLLLESGVRGMRESEMGVSSVGTLRETEGLPADETDKFVKFGGGRRSSYEELSVMNQDKSASWF